MISVIIPALNESKTIRSVVDFSWRDPRVSEVIVVEDGSIDGTPEIAHEAGAMVITSSLLGKGASMEDGAWTARNEILLYLDGDLTSLDEHLIERMTTPLIHGRADFVKAKFARRTGRVTHLTARPLLKSFFPEVASFDQPLGGIIAARRSLLRRIRFENDYGVDVGLLLDISATRATIAEVDIGAIEHDSHPLEALGDMAYQVARTILDRADRYGRLHMRNVRELQEAENCMHSDIPAIVKTLGNVERLALFDMDGTLVRGRFITRLAERANKTADLALLLDSPNLSPEDRTRRIASLFAGVPKSIFEDTARSMPLISEAVETVVALRKSGYRVGIVTDSFHVVSDIVRRRVFADFSLAHLLAFHDGKATGEVTIAPSMFHHTGCSEHSFCKANAMQHLIEELDLSPAEVLAVGDGENDICLLRAAGLSVAFQPKAIGVKLAAHRVVVGSLLEILDTLHPVERLTA